ncbi:hypothetical protein [Protofrankia coriariae]|uniref:Uncharacterized protein n=1 Tax=Protofrankia coriariae TaxID=1562887 RepID=A0ABR5F5L9_9ACTN|nr:hypothetical protein [Protofrankia coriariae]KLL12032.1 hypothetical protein FrCorBMG51_07100 [Protofrankia coriariae]
MRWEALFADLEMQWEAAEAAELDAELIDRSRREAAYLRLIDRLRPAIGSSLRLGVQVVGRESDSVLTGQLTALGVDWMLLREPAAHEVLVPLHRVLWVHGLAALSAHPGHEGPLAVRLDLRYVLRGVARDRSSCAVVLADGTPVRGTVDRVGADFVEVAEHLDDEFRRARSVRAVRTIPLAAIGFVRRTV